jgi:hypothetical protein
VPLLRARSGTHSVGLPGHSPMRKQHGAALEIGPLSAAASAYAIAFLAPKMQAAVAALQADVTHERYGVSSVSPS